MRAEDQTPITMDLIKAECSHGTLQTFKRAAPGRFDALSTLASTGVPIYIDDEIADGELRITYRLPG